MVNAERADAAVLYEHREPWGWLQLNRPQVHNAFDITMRDRLYELLGATQRDTSLAGIVIHGAGPSFGTGGDLREFSLQPQPWRAKSVRRARDVWRRLRRFPGLTVAVLHGNVAGSGLELALSCDVRLATPESRWLLPESGYGLIPGAGGTQYLPALLRRGRAAALMLMDGELSGAQAQRLGLVAALLPSAGEGVAAPAAAAERVAAAADWLRGLMDSGPQRSPELLRRLVGLLRQGQELSLAAGLGWEAAHQPPT